MASIEMEKIVRALQCDDPACACRRNGTRKHKVHCFAGCTQDSVVRALKQKGLLKQKDCRGRIVLLR